MPSRAARKMIFKNDEPALTAKGAKLIFVSRPVARLFRIFCSQGNTGILSIMPIIRAAITSLFRYMETKYRIPSPVANQDMAFKNSSA